MLVKCPITCFNVRVIIRYIKFFSNDICILTLKQACFLLQVLLQYCCASNITFSYIQELRFKLVWVSLISI
jgi:hypothetical protein